MTTEIFLSRYLVEQVDKQARADSPARRAARTRPRGDDLLPDNGFDLRRRGRTLRAWPELGSLSAVVSDGEVIVGRHPDAGRQRHRPVHRRAGVVGSSHWSRCRPTATAHTVTIDGFGDYRVVASTLPDGASWSTGCRWLRSAHRCVQLGIIMGIVTGIALLAGGFAVFWIVRPVPATAGPGGRRPPARSAPAAGSRARSTSVSGCRSGTPTPAPRSARSAPR